MAALEAVLKISAQDDTAKALAAIKEKIAGIERTAQQMDRFVASVSKVTRSTDPLASSLLNAEKALASQRTEIGGVVAALERMTGPTDRAVSAQRSLAREVDATTNALSRQGAAATRNAERGGGGGGGGFRMMGGGGHGGGEHGGIRGALGDVSPFLAPEVDEGYKKYLESGANVEEEIARLKAAGAKDEQIAKAREDFRNFTKTHSGYTEREYLAGFRNARVIAPGESNEMAELGARYQLALRNSGISTSEYDVENVMKIMDELGFKTGDQREHWLNSFTKAQQAFGGQIRTETALSAYRNAKQSIYGWDDTFRDKYFPTLLQSSGQQGGTEMMTALNNYVGGHMTDSELKALADAGFVRPQDLRYNKTGDVKGLKPHSQLFEKDVFKRNIAQWAWDFHDSFMGRKGATEDGFDDLIAKMPRNMAGLIAFLIHNKQRFQRDADTVTAPVGMPASEDKFLAANPVAGFEALRESIEQFAATVSQPSMKAAAAGLQEMAHAIQGAASSLGDWSAQHPGAAKALSIGAGATGAAAAAGLSLQMAGGLANWFGFAGAGGAAGTAGEFLLGTVPWLAGAAAVGAGGYYMFGPGGPIKTSINAPSYSDAPSDADIEASRRSRMTFHPLSGAWVDDPEAARGRGMANLGERHGPIDVNGIVHGDATVQANISVTASSELISIVQAAKQVSAQMALNPVAGGHAGRMDSDAAPGHGGIGSR